jgi:hypothetical protein
VDAGWGVGGLGFFYRSDCVHLCAAGQRLPAVIGHFSLSVTPALSPLHIAVLFASSFHRPSPSSNSKVPSVVELLQSSTISPPSAFAFYLFRIHITDTVFLLLLTSKAHSFIRCYTCTILFLLIPCTLRYPSHCLFVLESARHALHSACMEVSGFVRTFLSETRYDALDGEKRRTSLRPTLNSCWPSFNIASSLPLVVFLRFVFPLRSSKLSCLSTTSSSTLCRALDFNTAEMQIIQVPSQHFFDVLIIIGQYMAHTNLHSCNIRSRHLFLTLFNRDLSPIILPSLKLISPRISSFPR